MEHPTARRLRVSGSSSYYSALVLYWPDWRKAIERGIGIFLYRNQTIQFSASERSQIFLNGFFSGRTTVHGGH
jgi:hypothetical protein